MPQTQILSHPCSHAEWEIDDLRFSLQLQISLHPGQIEFTAGPLVKTLA